MELEENYDFVIIRVSVTLSFSVVSPKGNIRSTQKNIEFDQKMMVSTADRKIRLFVELRENYDCAIIIYLTTAQNLYSEIPPAGTKH